VSNTSDYKLYRVDWEEKDENGQYVSAYAYAASKVEIKVEDWGVEDARNVVIRLAEEVEEEAYQNGFEDGFDVATVQHRLKDMQKGRENLLAKSGCGGCGGDCQCGQ
jgi:uncharacterized membrane-anchored protein